MIRKTLWHIALFFMALLLVTVVKTVDQSMPVIKNFKILHQEVSVNGGVIIDGSLEKVRNCTFEGMAAYADDAEPVYVRVVEKPSGVFDTSRVVRFQLWGPWEVLSDPDTKTIEIFATHRCHIFWPVTSELTKFTVVRVQPHGTKP